MCNGSLNRNCLALTVNVDLCSEAIGADQCEFEKCSNVELKKVKIYIMAVIE